MLDCSQMSRSSNESYSFKSTDADVITCTQRIFDGPGSADYSPVFSGTARQAENWVLELQEAIRVCRTKTQAQARDRLVQLRQQHHSLANEIAALERTLKGSYDSETDPNAR